MLRIGRAALAMSGLLMAGGAGAQGTGAVAGAAATPMTAESSALGADTPHGELQLRRTERRAATLGPLAAADELQPGIVALPASAWSALVDLRTTWRAKVSSVPLSLGLHALAQADRADGGATSSSLQAQELQISADLGPWQLSAGRKVVAWDVGFGFRPNDVVQQEVRRTLVAESLTGHPLVMAEHFGAESAYALVWVNPHHRGDDALASRDAGEAALAARGYWRLGALDAHAFARQGERTGASLGAAAAWVADDELSLHLSWRRMQHDEGWAFDAAAGQSPVPSIPYSWSRAGAATQALLGLQWTGSAQQGLLLEAWFDGTAPSDAEWRQWLARNESLASLRAAGVPAPVLAGNLAWQANAMDRSGLLRRNLFARLSWQATPWDLAFDTLYTPGDDGRMHTLSIGWQGDRIKLTLAARSIEGPPDAVLRQTPVRRSAVLNASLAY